MNKQIIQSKSILTSTLAEHNFLKYTLCMFCVSSFINSFLKKLSQNTIKFDLNKLF